MEWCILFLWKLEKRWGSYSKLGIRVCRVFHFLYHFSTFTTWTAMYVHNFLFVNLSMITHITTWWNFSKELNMAFNFHASLHFIKANILAGTTHHFSSPFIIVRLAETERIRQENVHNEVQEPHYLWRSNYFVHEWQVMFISMTFCPIEYSFLFFSNLAFPAGPWHHQRSNIYLRSDTSSNNDRKPTLYLWI